METFQKQGGTDAEWISARHEQAWTGPPSPGLSDLSTLPYCVLSNFYQARSEIPGILRTKMERNTTSPRETTELKFAN